MHFSKKSGRLSSAGAEIQALVSHCSANFQPILDCFIPNFKLKYEDSENIKVDCVNTVVFNLHQIKRRACFFFGTPGRNTFFFSINGPLIQFFKVFRFLDITGPK